MPQPGERAARDGSPRNSTRVSVHRASGAPADGSAPSTVEYAIIAVLIAAVAVGTWKTFGETSQPDASSERALP